MDLRELDGTTDRSFQVWEQTGLICKWQVSNEASSLGGWDDTFYSLFWISHFSAAPYHKRLTCKDYIDGSQTFGSQDSHMINY